MAAARDGGARRDAAAATDSMDLEDQILNTNLLRQPDPEPYRVDSCDDDDCSEEEENIRSSEGKAEAPDARLARIESVIPGFRDPNRRNTGIKGVLSDKQEAIKRGLYNSEVAALKRQAAIDRITKGVLSSTPSISYSSKEQRRKNLQGEHISLSDCSDDESDDDFMEQYRAKRLLELQRDAFRPEFGQLQEVGPFEFVDAVDLEDKRVAVVTHVYEEYLQPCRRLNHILDVLARKYVHVKFLRLQATKAREDYELDALPTLILYRGGTLVEAIVCISDELGADFTADDVEWLLQGREIFESSQHSRTE